MLIIPQVRKQFSEIVRNRVRNVREDGIVDYLNTEATRVKYISVIFLFKILFGSITRDEMIQRARRSGQYWEYGSSEEIEIRDQESKDEPELFEKYSKIYNVKRPFVCELDGGYVINSSDPLVLTRDRKVVMEAEKPIFGPRDNATRADTPFHRRTEYSDRTTSERMSQLCRGYVRSHSWLGEQARFEAVFPLIRRDTSYYHWLLDQLPTIRGLRRYKEATNRDPTVIVEANPPNWIQETLSLVGIDNVVPLNKPVVRADRLVLSSCRESVPRNQSVYEPSRADIDWLNLEMKSRAPSPSGNYPDKIFISRQDFVDRGRYVKNFGELERVLEEFGVEICTPETLPIAEQIRLYENADLLMGAHGAGLTNMIFSEGTCVVEFLNNAYPSYQHLSQLCGHEYRFLQCEGGSDHHTPIEVDVTELRDLLGSVDKATSSTA